MSMSNTWETGLLALLCNNTAFTGVGDAGGLLPSSVAGSLYISLHTGDPGEGGDQTTSEAAYTDYARAAIARSGAGWTVSGNEAVNAAQVQWPKCTGLTANCTHFGIGTSSAGAGKLLYSNTLDSPLAVSNNITPTADAGVLKITMD